MTGRDPHSSTGRKRERSSLGSGRASKAVGDPKEKMLQNKRLEQRGSAPSSRGTTRTPATAKGNLARSRSSSVGTSSTNRGSQAGQNSRAGSSSTRKKKPTSRSDHVSPTPVLPSIVRQQERLLLEWWHSLAPHHQQCWINSGLLILSLLLLASLTIWRTAPILSAINSLFLALFGWSAYLLAVGLVTLALVRLIEAIRQQQLVRLSLVIGVICIWLLVLAESALLLGSDKTGFVGALLVHLFQGWSQNIGHVIILGLLLITCTLTFRLTFGHLLLVIRFFGRLFADSTLAQSDQTSQRNNHAPQLKHILSFLGQGLPYSRYAAHKPDADAAQEPATNAEAEQDIDDELLIDIDLKDDNDQPPQQQSPRFPHRAGTPRALNPAEHQRAVRDVRQPVLPLPQQDDDEQEELIIPPAGRIILPPPLIMEPLAPNPHILSPNTPVPVAPISLRTPSTKKRKEKQEAGEGVEAPRAATAQAHQSLWKLPTLSLLKRPDTAKLQLYGDETAELAKVILNTLRSFRVDAEVRAEDISIGPTVIRFGIRPTGKPEVRKDDRTGKIELVKDSDNNIVYKTRTRVSRIMALQNDLALVLEAKTIRMEAPVPGRPYVGVEIPNKNSRLVTLREVLESKEYQAAQHRSKLTIGLGKDVAGQVRVGDLAKMPHLLIAGATGSGKSICLNTIIASILLQATPDDVRFLMVDPKMVELNMYNGIPHLLSPVVIEVDQVVSLLKNAIHEMERRYRLFSQLGVRNLDGYRRMRQEKIARNDMSLGNIPAIVIIIDELADLMMAAPEEVEGMICRLAQLARATGIHLVVATQRPSVNVITGLIKANIPTRISFMVSSAVDSRTIIDMGGAERLLGRGDMLYLPADAGRPERIQGAFLSDEEAQALAKYWREQLTTFKERAHINPEQIDTHPIVESGWEIKEKANNEQELADELLEKAEEVVREYGKASISLLQRRLRIGYSRAARLIDLLEEHGIIGRSEASGRSRAVYEQGYNNHKPQESNDGHSLANEVADIVAEERERKNFLREQAARFPKQRRGRNMSEADD
jgi:DNA segregation ATPase FtsK/SpoIIIE-like protein